MEQIRGKIFVGETIRFGRHKLYTNCGFENCVLEFDGSGFPGPGCTFQGCQFTFNGDASRTIGFIKQLWETPGMSPIIETLFTEITGSAALAKQLAKRRKAD